MPAVVYGESLRRTYANPAYKHNADLVRRVSREEWFQRALMEAFLYDQATSRPSAAEYPEDIHVMPLPGNLVVALVIDQSERYDTAALREDFIANASHELNTPASAISLLAEALAKTVKKGSKAESFAKSLVEEADRLTLLTRDIVRLSAARSADEFVDTASFDMRELVEAVVEAHVALARQVGVSVEYGGPQAQGDHTRQGLFTVRGSQQQVDVALSNLVENAIQHSPEGASVTVTLQALGGRVRASVVDRGPGIPKELHKQIFQRFYRVDPARSRKAGGTGLGLAIARNTARKLGGDVTVHSEAGRGARFTLDLPARDRDNPMPADAPPEETNSEVPATTNGSDR